MWKCTESWLWVRVDGAQVLLSSQASVDSKRWIAQTSQGVLRKQARVDRKEARGSERRFASAQSARNAVDREYPLQNTLCLFPPSNGE